jgi:hypothetical protein
MHAVLKFDIHTATHSNLLRASEQPAFSLEALAFSSVFAVFVHITGARSLSKSWSNPGREKATHLPLFKTLTGWCCIVVLQSSWNFLKEVFLPSHTFAVYVAWFPVVFHLICEKWDTTRWFLFLFHWKTNQVQIYPNNITSCPTDRCTGEKHTVKQRIPAP